jgi:anti-sigma factor RsiW
MNCIACDRWLHDYVDGTLNADEARTYETHVAGCRICQNEIESLRRLGRQTRALPREISPGRDLWTELQKEISAATAAAAEPIAWSPSAAGRSELNRRETTRSTVLGWLAPVAMAASIAILATFAERRIVPRSTSGWSVAALSGTPRVDARDVREETKMRVGQWLVTDKAARAKVVVGAIGEVSLEPNSRLRLVGMAANDHRLELARGTLNAMIWAPPRLFFVDTPSATAVDLGCAYTLTVDDEGNGELQVTTGFVALEDRGRESILRTGMMCLTRRGIGPGTPFAVDAPAPLRAALARFDFERGAADAALAEVLTHARPHDSITLWHLLDRTQGPSRAAVFDALATFSAPPASVTRAGILGGDARMRKAWGSDLGIDRF